jgi:PAS domain S-box-containing protein
LAGEATWFENQRFVMQRHGFPEETYFSYSYSPIHDEMGSIAGVFCACTETTQTVLTTRQLRETEAALREANEAVRAANWQLAAETRRLRQLFEQAPGFIAVLRGPDHVFELTNAAYLQLVGHRDSVGKPVREALPELEGQGYFELLDQVYETGEAFVGEQMPVVLQRSPGGATEERYVDFVYQPITSADGTVIGIFCEGYDVTERAQAEQALRRLTETLEEQVEARTRELKAAEEALRQSQKMEALGQLTGGIAHDFNNLLSAMNGSLELIRRKPEDSKRVRRLAETGLNAGARGAKLTGQLLAFSRAQKLELRAVVVADLLMEMRDLLARSLGPLINLQLQPDRARVPVLADPTQLELAILNLAINARDAMPEGGGLTIGLHSQAIKGDPALPDGHYLEVRVSDTGSGMPPEVAARAFEPFFTTKGVGEGTGLGLSQVYALAQRSGGTARIESCPGKGTTVRLFLRQSERADGESAQGQEPSSRARAAAAAKVLVVDDDQDVRAVLVESLESFGYEVVEAEDGEAGLKALARTEPNLVLLDFAMPGMNGAEVAREARASRPELPIVFVSGYANTAAIEKVMGANATVLRKPFRVEELEAVVSEALQQV